MANSNGAKQSPKMAAETPKAVSSRLLTMKFMQRAVASAASSPSSPDTDSPSSKRRKMQHSPAQSRLHAAIDEAAIKAALEDQEAKRQAALAQHFAGDTHWVLNPKLNNNTSGAGKASASPLKIVYVGYGDIDSGNESGDNEDEPQIGRTSNRKTKDAEKKKTPKSTEKDGSDSGSGSSDESSDDSDASDSDDKNKPSQTPTSRSRSQSRSRNSIESKRAKEFRDKRRKKEIRMNQITSISSGGASSNSSPMSCYKCKQAGHKAINCPRGNSRPQQRG